MTFSASFYSPEFKTKVVLETITAEQSIEEIAEKYQLTTDTVMEWRNLFLKVIDIALSKGEEVTFEQIAKMLKGHKFDYNEILYGKFILDSTFNLVNLCDIEAHEVLYMNKACKEAYGVVGDEYHHRKCYNVFYGFDAPCEFCTSPELLATGTHQWIGRNPTNNIIYQLTDALLELDGRKIRMEIGVDINDKENLIQEKERLIQELDKKISMDETLFACIRTLTAIMDTQQAIEKILELVCVYHQGTRGYIVELNQEGTHLSNTYEWCAPGVSKEIENLQDIPKEVASDWFDNFEKKGSFSISSLDHDVDPSSTDYRILDSQGIKSLMAAPLIQEGIIKGFIGVDDPAKGKDDFSLLSSIPYFILNDIQKRHMFLELERMSFIDVLTQLYNRNKYMKDLEEMELNRPETLGVIYIDINGLKVANDQFGHSYGDRMLKKMAELLRNTFNTKHTYRIGGDEFVVLCPNCSRSEFEDIGLKIRTEALNVKELKASIGITWGEKNYKINQLIRHADDLMYANKQRYYKSIQVDEYNHKSSLVKQVLSDLKEGRYLVYLQPKTFLGDGTLVGAEALIRGTDKSGELILPDNFISLYESHGIIRHIDFYVLETVCELIRDLELRGKTIQNISVNFSRITLLEYDVVTQMLALCRKYNVSPSRITIEVTESTPKLQVDELVELVHEIKEMGFDISLDDYGAKYSNMSILTNVGFDEIKLDRSIISQLTVNEKTRTIAEYTIKMLKELKMCRVVAEGIESPAELDIVKSYGCDYGQGYHFSRPISIQEFLSKYYDIQE